MKKFFFFLVILGFAFGLESFGQRQPILPYGNYSPEVLKKYLEKNTFKAKKIKEELLLKTGEISLDTLFSKVYLADTTLLEGKYDNSRWNVETQKIEYFTGVKFTGKVYLYKNEVFETILYKDTCANIINAGKKYLNLINEDQEGVPDTTNVKGKKLKEVVSVATTDTTVTEEVNESVTKKEKPEHGKFYYWQKKNGLWFYPATGLLLGGVGGFVFPSKGYTWYHLFPKGVTDPHGTMSGGRPADAAETNTGGTGGRGD